MNVIISPKMTFHTRFTLNTEHKSLLIRADFILGHGQGANRRICKRWRSILVDALPRLLGCQRRSPEAERVRLRSGEEARYTAWLRLPVERRPGRKRLRRLKTKLRGRLESALLPIDGRILKVGVRRCRVQAMQSEPGALPASPCSSLAPYEEREGSSDPGVPGASVQECST
jgi:hypothetical protein